MRVNKITQLSERDHMLLRPTQYIGSTTLTQINNFTYNEETDKFEFGQISYVPALLKIISEIIDNALDEAIRTNFQFATKISIDIDKTSVKVNDSGRGIPLSIDPTSKVSQLELALAYPRAGANFNDDERNSIGMNGIGSYATNVLSKKFKAISITGKEKGILTCSNNLENRDCKITKFVSDKVGTTVEFEPDLTRFGLTEIDDTHQNLVYQRILFLSITYPEITFKFNGKVIRFRNPKNFLASFGEKCAQVTHEKYIIGIAPNPSDDFNSKSTVNGADCINEGNHIDYLHSEIINRIRGKLEKKYPNIKAGDIKNKLTYVVTMRDFLKPLFDSQTKEKFTSDISEIRAFFADVDWDKLVTQIIKTPEIIDPIVETFRIREELKHRQALNRLNKSASKNFKCEKFLPATKNKKYMVIAEGNSASAGLSSCMGRSDYGFFASRGVPLNAYDATTAEFLKNEELSNIVKILGLEIGAKEQNLDYENIVLAMDADCFQEDHEVWTKDGVKKLKDVALGDLVFTHKNEYKRVVNIIEKTKNAVIKITIENDTIITTENHLFPIYRNGQLTLVHALELELTDELFIRQRHPDAAMLKIHPRKIERVRVDNMKFIDITVEDHHSFFVFMPKQETYLLTHNCDGFKIASLYVGFFIKYAPSVIRDGKLKKLRTPIVALKDKADKIKKFFFTFNEYNDYISKNGTPGLRVHYYKGLGSWEPEDLRPLIDKHGLEYFLEEFVYDKTADQLVDDWLNGKKADKRKEYLREHEFSIFSI